MAWIQVEAGTRDHPKILKLSRDCNMTVANGLGTVVSLWLWSAIHCPDGDLSSFDPEDIEMAAGWTGEGGIWYRSAVKRKLLDETEHGAQIHDSQDYTSSWKEAQRMRDYRINKRVRTVLSHDSAELSHDSAPDRPTDHKKEVGINPNDCRRPNGGGRLETPPPERKDRFPPRPPLDPEGQRLADVRAEGERKLRERRKQIRADIAAGKGVLLGRNSDSGGSSGSRIDDPGP
ncbi:MAG: hypothetical protein V2B18_12375, partial [Pseudomonadota bacterium]